MHPPLKPAELARRSERMNLSFRFTLALGATALVAIACRGGQESDPVPVSLPGSYVYAVKGSTFKKQWQFAGRLELKPDRSYAFRLDKTIDGEKDSPETSVGTYSVSADHVLIHDPGRRDASKDIHKLLIKSDSLIAEVGWTAEIFLKGVGAPNIVFVKERGQFEKKNVRELGGDTTGR